jgi:hypothetical protein
LVQWQTSEEEQPDKTIVDELFGPFVMIAMTAYLLSLMLSATYFMKVT